MRLGNPIPFHLSQPLLAGWRKAMGHVALVAALGLARSVTASAPVPVKATPAPSASVADERAWENGHIEEAISKWRAMVEKARRAKDNPTLIDGLLGLGEAYHSLGEHRRAVEALLEARDLAKKIHDQRRTIAALNSLGAVRMFSHDAEYAQEHLDEALKLAHETGDTVQAAAVQNNLGMLLAAAGKYPEAHAAFAEAAAHLADPTQAAQARANLADAALHEGKFDEAKGLNEVAVSAAEHLPDGREKAVCLMRGGKTWELLFQAAPPHEQGLRMRALKLYEDAARISEAAGDKRTLSFALGYSGHLYEQEKKNTDAMKLTRRAAFLAQQAQAPDSLYLWEWQTGRLERAAGLREPAIADYQRTVRELDHVRNDLSARLGNANARSSYREAAGAVYFELADLLLQRADGMKDPKAIDACLREARDTCETLKSVELEDYFQDDCVNIARSKTKTLENLSPTAAIVYIIPLPDRTEIILSLNGKLYRQRAPVNAEDLTTMVRAFREHLQTRISEEYLVESQQLYTLLIKPLEPIFEKEKTDTLVFVPDGALRTVPMAALHDGTKFLIERYAIAVTPGLTLMEPKPLKRENARLMAAGLTKAVTREGQQFAALPNVTAEIANLQKLYGGMPLMDQAFSEGSVEKAVGDQPVSMVHIASHGEFSGDVRKTFVLTYDGTITLDGLERLLRPSQLRDQPIELLTLSACQTAAGDDRAALGLAGIAIKAGARAALATLWSVNDAASTKLISDFYGTLRHEPGVSKAKALQRAQIHLLADAPTSHPCLWAPYLIIGNWL